VLFIRSSFLSQVRPAVQNGAISHLEHESGASGAADSEKAAPDERAQPRRHDSREHIGAEEVIHTARKQGKTRSVLDVARTLILVNKELEEAAKARPLPKGSAH